MPLALACQSKSKVTTRQPDYSAFMTSLEKLIKAYQQAMFGWKNDAASGLTLLGIG
jgi:hypothetical protein